ncbi:MAG: alkaline phosphatase [Puniceicoccales bacterium]|jgi:alkaline phosphatase|nr:alkaline phosphatase [Puniceicoccales bacterium]
MTTRRSFLKNAAASAAVLGLLESKSASANPRSAKANSANKRARNIIFMVADGMNTASLAATRHFQKLVLGRDNAWLSLLKTHPAVRALVETSSASDIVTDSAAASSCWGSGQRYRNGVINIDEDGRAVEPLFSKAKRAGLATGLVTTATVTHATPAGFAANVEKRGNEVAIARQYLERHVDILLGGGKAFFDNDLRAKFQKADYALVETRKDLLAAMDKVGPLLGLFAKGHLPFTIDRGSDIALRAKTPTLAEMSAAALRRLAKAPNGFILQIEGARVDHAGHANDAATLLHDMLAFDEAVTTALDFAEKTPDTLLILTTDHGTGGMNINGVGPGYGDSQNAFFRLSQFTKSYPQMKSEARAAGVSQLGEYLKSVTGLRLTGRPLQRAARAFGLAQGTANLADVFKEFTGIGWTSGNHTGDLIELAALGPGAERFSPLLRNDEIHALLLAAIDIR